MVAISDVARIFQRRGWRYEIPKSGILVAKIEGVGIGITIEEGNRSVLVVALLVSGQGARGEALQARARDLDTLLDACNRLFNRYSVPGTFLRVSNGVNFVIRVVASSGGLNEQQLVFAVELAVGVAQGFGPILEALAFGRISLQQALDSLAQAEAEVERELRRRSA